MKSLGKIRADSEGTFFRIPEDKRADPDFKKRLDCSVRSLRRVPPLPLSKEMRRNILSRGNIAIRYDQWLLEAVKTAPETLRALYFQHGVTPEAVLGDLV